jgi:hypothetical protein
MSGAHRFRAVVLLRARSRIPSRMAARHRRSSGRGRPRPRTSSPTQAAPVPEARPAVAARPMATQAPHGSHGSHGSREMRAWVSCAAWAPAISADRSWAEPSPSPSRAVIPGDRYPHHPMASGLATWAAGRMAAPHATTEPVPLSRSVRCSPNALHGSHGLREQHTGVSCNAWARATKSEPSKSGPAMACRHQWWNRLQSNWRSPPDAEPVLPHAPSCSLMLRTKILCEKMSSMGADTEMEAN